MCTQSASSMPDGFSCNLTRTDTWRLRAFSLTRWHRSTNAFVGTNLSQAPRPHQKQCARLVVAESLSTNKTPHKTADTQGTSMKITVATFLAGALGIAIVASVYSTQVRSESTVAEAVSPFDGKTR